MSDKTQACGDSWSAPCGEPDKPVEPCPYCKLPVIPECEKHEKEADKK